MAAQSRIFPALRYRDPRAAINFLIAAFGFETHAVHKDPGGAVAHAELRMGRDMIMLGQLNENIATSGRTVSGGAASLYVSVPFVDAHFDKAVAAGAKIIRAPHDTDYGSREYSCRDLEGFEWSFGSYDPLAVEE